jgi:hypothetical protein
MRNSIHGGGHIFQGEELGFVRCRTQIEVNYAYVAISCKFGC